MRAGALNKEILRLSLPSILANLTIPLVGFADTAVAGHLEGAEGAAAFIGAISIGAMLFNLLYWNFSFLRTGTGGLTAQAYGRGDMHGSAVIFFRSISLGVIVSIAILAVRLPFLKLCLLIVDASPQVEALAADYFRARVWAAPATIALMSFSGWFVGMQDSLSSMFKDLTVNTVNIAASILLSFGAGGWKGLGFIGVAWGTVAAQYCGLLFCILVCIFKYREKVFRHFKAAELKTIFKGPGTGGFFRMNADLVVRSLGFTGIYVGYTMIAARFGDTLLACSSIMMQILMLYSYFTDGFAYAGEALSGRFLGARDKAAFRDTVKYVFIWCGAIASIFTLIYAATGTGIVRVLTTEESVVACCRKFLPWLVLMPVGSCAAFTWDGIYTGVTSTRSLRNTMTGAFAAFLAVWFLCKLTLSPEGDLRLHCLLGAYFAHLAFRSLHLSARYKKDVLNKL